LRHNRLTVADRDFVFAAVADERRQIADVIDGLDEAQLASPSLCEGWDIRTVAAHLVSVFADSFWVFQATALRRRSLASAIDDLARRGAQHSADDIAATLRRNADYPLSPPVFGPLDPLADILVHSGDIRIPLGLPFSPRPERTELALDFLTRPWRIGFVPRGRLRGLRLCANDVDRSWGAGLEVRGPAAALMMAAAGRIATLDALDGAGLSLLRDRISTSSGT
jgi:uncharacterized protein (TIGR03083 family)